MPVESDPEIRALLGLERIAVVGCSREPEKDAHAIPKYLHEHGYDVVPVNPNAESIFDRQAHDSLTAVPGTVDMVDVFRPSEEVAGIVEEAVDRGDVRAIWTQLGIRDTDATARAEAEGITVIEDRCIKVEHQRLLARPE